jgi:hypothetical protein
MNRRPENLDCEPMHRRSSSSQPLTRYERQLKAWGRMYRAHVEAESRHFPELTVFVEADSTAEAEARIQQACRAIGYAPLTPDEEWRIRDLRSVGSLIDTGLSAVQYLRLFEKGCNSDGHIVWIRAPIFAVRDPVELTELWLSMIPKWRRGR